MATNLSDWNLVQKDLEDLAARLGNALKDCGLMLALAESCTGGWIAECVTAIPGSSAWFDRGFVTYSNEAKTDMLGVGALCLEQFGAVSRETALAMAAGALKHSRAQIALAVTGIAGPGGGSPEKPVGLVYLAWQVRNFDGLCLELRFQGSRQEIRRQTVATGLQCLLAELQNPSAMS